MGIAVVEDAAQAFGVATRQEKCSESIERCACFSFFPTRLLGAYGDGGLVTTNDARSRRMCVGSPRTARARSTTTLGGTTPAARVRIVATGRDRA